MANKQVSDKMWVSFSENILIQIKDTGAKVATTCGPIDELNVYKDFDFYKYNFYYIDGI